MDHQSAAGTDRSRSRTAGTNMLSKISAPRFMSRRDSIFSPCLPNSIAHEQSDEHKPLKAATNAEEKLHLLHDSRRRLRDTSDGVTTPMRKDANHRHDNGSNGYSSTASSHKSYSRVQNVEGADLGDRKQRKSRIGALTIGLSVLAMGLGVGALFFDVICAWWNGRMVHSSKKDKPLFDEAGRYVMEDFDALSPFSDFLPGLAGIYGKPLYAFFVNRGQAIASFGVESKDYPILEFQSANKAYQNTPLLGFRTFVQGSRRSGDFVVEPYSPLTTNFPQSSSTSSAANSLPSELPKRVLYNGENELQLQELDFQNHLETNVTYFVLPEEDYGAFVRRTTITNTHSREPVTLSILDGLTRMEPAGGKLNGYLKDMGRTLQGFMGVHFPYNDSIAMPFYRLTTQPSDTAAVHVQEAGHFCLSVLQSKTIGKDVSRLLPVVYDPSKVFGEDTSLLRPVELFSKSIGNIVSGPQYAEAKTASCFAAVESITLEPGETATISTFYGRANRLLDVPVLARQIMQEGFVTYKLMRTREVIRQITKSVSTQTSHQLFNAHIQQMFLDNSLRGGIPLILGDEDDGMSNVDENPRLKVFHVFSRKHGDLERDYNDFKLSPSFFSQGPGDFRDVIQNRRDDVVFNPRIGSFNVRTFLSYIQADGYQPLSVESVVFTIEDIHVCQWVAEQAVGRADGHRAQREALISILNDGPFRPGQVFGFMQEHNIELIISRQEFIDIVASASQATPVATYKTGYWADHWTYYMDMIKSYLSLYPDKEYDLLYSTELPYYFSPAWVQPRSRKYVLTLDMDGWNSHVRQLDATMEDSAKVEYMDQFRSNKTGWYGLNAYWQNDDGGSMFQSSVAAKLLLLGTLKFATRDAYGMGIEYEGGKPGWDDANNGLAGMLGSGMPETFELKVLLQYLLDANFRHLRPVDVPVELFDLIEEIGVNLDLLGDISESLVWPKKLPPALFEYWDRVASAREKYRERVKITFSGNTTKLAADEVSSVLSRWLEHIDQGIARAISFGTASVTDNRTIPTYFAYDVTKYNMTGESNSFGHPLVIAEEMHVITLPTFLEGPTRMLKTVLDTTNATAIYQQIKFDSGLRDQGLGMYTISAALEGQTFDIGRTMAFPSGWAENQGVWMHMSYKFYLEMLRHRLYEEFFEEATSGGLLPFIDPKLYGRSMTECSSFIASSAFEDPSKIGRGYLARLSGSTAEFLSMWIIMFIGPEPFYLDPGDHRLRMQLVPALPIWMFESRNDDDLDSADDQGKLTDTLLGQSQRQYPNALTIRFKLFSSIQVRYYNERRTDLFGISPSRYRIGFRDGTVFEIKDSAIGVDLADKIRRVVFVDSIEAYF